MYIRIIDEKDAILNEVIELGKRNASKLGLFPVDAFKDHAKKKWIFVAEDKNKKFLGYILFRITQSKGCLYVTHLCIVDEYRKIGVAASLLNAVKDKYSPVLRGMGLSCREDYLEASAFWKKFGFKPKQRVRSRSKVEKYLNKWWFDFGNHDLFSLSDIGSDKARALLDANILIKLRDENTESNSQVSSLLADWLVEQVDYYYAPEIFNEIHRDSQTDRATETRKFVQQFKEAKFKHDKFEEILLGIKQILSGNSDNDQSDQKQIAECIASGIPYFITTDIGILTNREKISSKFTCLVISPSELILQIDELQNKSKYMPSRLAGVNCDFKNAQANDLQAIISAFHRGPIGEKRHELSLILSNSAAEIQNCSLKLVKDGDGDSTAIIVQRIEESSLAIPVVRIKKGQSLLLFRQLITDAVQTAVISDKKIIEVSDQWVTEEEKSILEDCGFDQYGQCWRKYAISWVGRSGELFKETTNINEANLSVIETKLKVLDPQELFTYKLKLERKFWPVKFSDLSMPTYIIPIKPYWASELFDHYSSSESLFGSRADLIWNNENIYYRNVKPVSEKHPGRLLWYASSDPKLNRTNGIVACSYLDETHVDTPKRLFQRFRKFGVYEWEHVYKLANKDVTKEIKVLKFSNTELFKKPVKLAEIGNIFKAHNKSANTFASPVEISNEIFLDIYKKGKQII